MRLSIFRGGMADTVKGKLRHLKALRQGADQIFSFSPMRRSPPPRRRSPVYEVPPPRRPEPPRDEVSALLEEAASEARSVFVSQLAAKLTSRDVGMFFQDKLGRGSVRDARVVTDRITRRSKGYVIAHPQFGRALTLS
jgi:hypothetical protein